MSEREAERFTINDVPIMRRPVEASMTDGTILRGYTYEREFEVAKGRHAVMPLDQHLLCLPGELGNVREHHDFAVKITATLGGPKRVYTLDMRGRGQSDLGDPNSNTMTDADDLISFCDAMNLHHCDVVANGRTALPVVLTAPKRPSMFRRIIFNDGGIEFDAVGLARQSAFNQRGRQPRDWDDAVALLKEMRGEQFTDLSDDEWADAARVKWAEKDGKPVPDIKNGLSRFTNSVAYDEKQPLFWTEFKILRRCPALLIRGANSRLVTPDIAQRLVEFHGGMREIVVPNEGHVPLLHRGDTADKVLEFLRL